MAFKEKRLSLRMSRQVPIVVSGDGENGEVWSEPTHTYDFSTTGTQFQLSHPVEKGQQLRLRTFTPDVAAIESTAIVTHTVVAICDSTRVGVLICEPVEDWIRFFASWVKETNTPSSENLI